MLPRPEPGEGQWPIAGCVRMYGIGPARRSIGEGRGGAEIGGSEQWDRALSGSASSSPSLGVNRRATTVMAQTSVSETRKPRKIRFLDAEWERIERRAHACGLPTATYVRKAALGVKLRARRNRTENELILQLGRIGIDLHRLARSAEESGDATARDDLRSALEEVLAAVRRIG